MTDAEYFDASALSYSGMKDLAVSPLRYWAKHIDPNRVEEEPTPEMKVGSAVHCAVLEPEEFDKRYARELEPPEGCLDTMADLRAWCDGRGIKAKGTRKAEVIAQIQAIEPEWPILEVLQARHAAEHAGKVIFKAEDWARVQGAAEALRREPEIKALLSEGRAEVPFFVRDPETGVALKAKMDWVRPDSTVDLKTFTQTRGKSIDQAVADAIYYERYFWQAHFYSMVRALADGNTAKSGPQTAPTFIIPFVESDPPHEVRIRSLRPKIGGEVNLYWEQARIEIRRLIRLYADCLADYGDNPWRSAQQINPLQDAEMKGLVFA